MPQCIVQKELIKPVCPPQIIMPTNEAIMMAY